MAERPKVLQDFLDSLQDELKRAKAGPEAKKCIDRVFDALKRPAPSGFNQPTRL